MSGKSMKSLWITALAAAAMICGAAQAETVVSVTQVRYDGDGRTLCTAVRMNPSAYGALPADACALGTEGSNGPDRISYTQYDNVGQIIEVDQAYGTAVQRAYARYTYTADGLKQTERDASGNTTQYEYDGFDRILKVDYPSTTAGSGTINTADYEQFSYDANSNKTWYRRRDGRIISYTFDALNQEITRSVSDGSVQTVYSGYDALGHLLYTRYGSTSGAGVTNAYDGLGRLYTTQDMNGRWIAYQFDQASNRTLMSFPDGQLQGYQYDSANRMVWTGIAFNEVGYAWGYDPNGRIGKIGRVNDASTYIGYDNLNRVTGYTNDFAGTAYDVSWGFSYNPAGQIAAATATSSVYDYKETDNTTVNKTYDGLNRDAALAAISGGYDANGNLTHGDNPTNTDTRQFYYDIYNRLTGVGSTAYPQNGPYLTLTYDPLGRLSSQTYYGTTTSFLYDGTNLIGEYDGSGNIQKRYMFTPGVDQPWVQFTGSALTAANATYFYTDYHGSIIALADSGGNVTNLYKYGPYGEPKNVSNGTDFTGSRFRYTGQMVLPEAGLYYYKARVYDPIMGRFLQTDPIGSKDNLDLYEYTNDDPVDGSDPTGNDTFQIGISGTINVFGLKIGVQAGIAVDNRGNVAAYGQGSGPVVSTAINATKVIMGAPASTLTKDVDASPKPKAFEGLGVTAGVSNASTVSDLGGKGSYQNVSAGDVVGGTLEHSSGSDSEKGTYNGVSLTIGEGAGGGVDAGKSYTLMSNSVNVPDVALKPIVNTVDNMAKQAVDQVRKKNGG